MSKSTRNIIASILVTAIMVGAVFYLYGNWEGYNTGFSAGSVGADVAVVTIDAASISADLNSTTFDFTSAGKKHEGHVDQFLQIGSERLG